MIALASRFPWASPNVIADLTPTQAMIVLEAKGFGGMFGPLAGLLGSGAYSGGDDWHSDPRFPGKKMRTFKSFAEAAPYMKV